jgi:hypothetical protein
VKAPKKTILVMAETTGVYSSTKRVIALVTTIQMSTKKTMNFIFSDNLFQP